MLGMRSVVCQPKFTKNKFKIKISKRSQKVLKQKGSSTDIPNDRDVTRNL